jgi:hypothetical protein
VRTFIFAFWQIILFRQGPQSLADSRALLKLVIAANFLLSMPLLALVSLSQGTLSEVQVVLLLVTETLLNLSVVALFVFMVLKYFGFLHRYRQTLTALLGTDAVFTVLMMPLFLLLYLSAQNQDSAAIALAALLAFVMMIVLVLWSLAVYAHIFAHTLSRSFRFGVVLAVANFIIVYLVGSLIPEI